MRLWLKFSSSPYAFEQEEGMNPGLVGGGQKGCKHTFVPAFFRAGATELVSRRRPAESFVKSSVSWEKRNSGIIFALLCIYFFGETPDEKLLDMDWANR